MNGPMKKKVLINEVIIGSGHMASKKKIIESA